ncbi:thermonuclease family protein [Nitrospira sp. KM1]|uniref:thermonuclease family protein n=1 Tax=Nitrospira sp. KM1 TaxID=1936990 RepID=UPI00351A6F89
MPRGARGGHSTSTGRTIADVLLADGADVNHQLVKSGWCWWYVPKDTVLERLEGEAREAKLELWTDASPVPPWKFRKSRRGRRAGMC